MAEKNEQKQKRPPVVAIVGHVDHGKTTLLDFIRKTNVAAREAGGITQAVGAYEIVHPRTNAEDNADQRGNGQRESASSQRESAAKITFIDTPGHEAFQNMRRTGAHIADLAVLVVAADDGVKPQTKEAIKILHETKTPFVVAINKTDKPGADIDKVKNELTTEGVLLEGYGGQVSWHGISAKTGDGVNDLLDLILLAADVEHLTYSPAAPCTGYILETKVDSRKGLQASVIIKNGTLKQGDWITTPTAHGRVRILENFVGKPEKQLHPSAPAVVVGFENLPKVGEEFKTAATEKELAFVPAAVGPRAVVEHKRGARTDEVSLNLILKASDAGSLTALHEVITSVPSEKPVKIVDETVGDITDGDVKTAIATGAVVIGFKSKPNQAAKNLATAQRVVILTSDIVYELVKSVEEFLKAPARVLATGMLEVLAIFNQTKLAKQLIGGKVTEGTFRNKARFNIERGGATVGHGKVASLQSQKKDLEAVATGNEAGLVVNSETAIAVDDQLIIK